MTEIELLGHYVSNCWTGQNKYYLFPTSLDGKTIKYFLKLGFIIGVNLIGKETMLHDYLVSYLSIDQLNTWIKDDFIKQLDIDDRTSTCIIDVLHLHPVYV